MNARRYFPAIALLVCSPLLALPAAGGTGIVYVVSAWVDTTDDLIFRGSNLHWEHPYAGSPAGTHGPGEQPTIISSLLDDVPHMAYVNWSGMWTGFSVSTSYTSLSPALPNGPGWTASVEKLSGRGSLSITEQPTAANNYTLKVKFQDGFNGAAFLDARITVVPEPMALGLPFVTGIFLMRRGRRSHA